MAPADLSWAEPSPASDLEGATQSALPLFVVQEHHATRLHWDFRLPIGAVLKSWAVPKGPPEEPGIKRLAMMVEDHPLDYAQFEGEIPAGEYGAGVVTLWDQGTWEPQGADPPERSLEQGAFQFRLHGRRLQGAYALVRMNQAGENAWLLIKERSG